MSRLGIPRNRRTQTVPARVVRPELPARPDVWDDGDELEVCWYPHRDAASLLPDDYPATDGERVCGDNRRRAYEFIRDRHAGGSQ